jgi:hypothetical protein
MALALETVGVGVIVGAALLWAGRSLWRAGRKKQICSTCGQAGSCPLVGNDQALPSSGESCGAVPDLARPPE